MTVISPCLRFNLTKTGEVFKLPFSFFLVFNLNDIVAEDPNESVDTIGPNPTSPSS